MNTLPAKGRTVIRYSVATLATAACLLAALPSAALEARPARVEIKSFNDTATISLTHRGNAVAATDISSVKLFVENHDYDHMITVAKTDGQVTIRPTEDLELGVYDLRIKTVVGEAVVEVISLQGIADAGLEARARRQGVSVEEIKAQLGISQTLDRGRVELEIPATYYVGQTLRVPMAPAAGRTGIWRVNGQVVPLEDASLSYVLEQAGVYDLAYIEKEGEGIAAHALGTVVVANEPPIVVTLDAGATITLKAPEGYTRHAWTVDGVDGVAAGTESAWRGAFDAPGTHRVRVRASEPAVPGVQAFRIVTYLVMVN